MSTVNSYSGFMPTPDKTSIGAIVLAAREILEHSGLAGLTMQAVALRVGVRAPSLYKRVQSRDDLLQLVAEATLSDLAACLDNAPGPPDLANEFRAFGHRHPAAFALVLTPGAGVPVARAEYSAAASARILQLAGRLAGTDHALQAARTLTAWAVGFISMELNGGFNLGGDVEAAWQFGVTRMLEVLSPSHPIGGAVDRRR